MTKCGGSHQAIKPANACPQQNASYSPRCCGECDPQCQSKSANLSQLSLPPEPYAAVPGYDRNGA